MQNAIETSAVQAHLLSAQTARTTAPIAVLDQVTKHYGKTIALDNLSLALYPGEIVALLGPNGAGKSTAVRSLLGLARLSQGSARVFGQDPRTPTTRTRIGAMLQVAQVPRTLRVVEHIDLFRAYYPAPLPTEEIVVLAGLGGLEQRLFDQLSGGQQQRLLFGLALAGNPDLLILDEPTLGLDVETRRSLWTTVRALAARGKTVLLTTHYLEEADALASRIVVIASGRIVAQGTPTEIKSRTAVRTLRCRTSIPAAEIWRIPGVIDVIAVESQITIQAGHPEGVLRHLLTADPSLAELELIAPNLEDAFLSLTRPN